MTQSWFSASLLQSFVSHDPSEIIQICWFAAQETFLIIIINVENSCAASYFFSEIFDEQSSRETVIFDKLNASFLNKTNKNCSILI